MRHRVAGNHLGRRTNVARALYRSLISEVLEHGRITTTLAKAKAVQGEIDKLINLAKAGSVNARRLTVKTMTTDRFFDKFSKSYPERKSGYSRIIRLGQRLSDTAEMVRLELLEVKPPETKPEVKPEKKHENNKTV